MFWTALDLNFETDGILSSEDCTLTKLLDANDVLEKTKEQSPKLIEYFSQRNILEELLKIITAEYSVSSFTKEQYKQAYLATEIFTCLHPPVQNHLLCQDEQDNPPLVEILINFFPTEGTINPLSASLVCRCLSHLTNETCHDMINYLKNHSFLHRIIGHFDTSAISDFVMQLFNFDYESSQSAIAWFIDEGAVFKLVNYLTPNFSEDYQDITSHFLDTLYVNLRNHLQTSYQNHQDLAETKRFMPINALSPNDESKSQEDNEKEKLLCSTIQDLLKQIESNDMLEALLDAVLYSSEYESHFVPVYATKVLLSAINKRKVESSFPLGAGGMSDINNMYDLLYATNARANSEDSSSSSGENKEDPQIMHIRESCQKVFSLLLPRLAKLRQILLETPKQTEGFNQESTPFGRNRAAICQLISAIASCECPRELEARMARDEAEKKASSKQNCSPDVGSLFGHITVADQKPPSASLQPVISNDAKSALINALIDENIFSALMELFYQFPNNTFVHETLKRLVDSVFILAGYEYIVKAQPDPLTSRTNSPTEESQENNSEAKASNDQENFPPIIHKQPELIHKLLSHTKLLQWILCKVPNLTNNMAGESISWDDPANVKPGYFGHLLSIVNKLIAFQQELSNPDENTSVLEKDQKCNPFKEYMSEADFAKWDGVFQKQVTSLNEITSGAWDSQNIEDDIPSTMGDPMSFFSFSNKSINNGNAILQLLSGKFSVGNLMRVGETESDNCSPLSFTSLNLPDPEQSGDRLANAFGPNKFQPGTMKSDIQDDQVRNLSECSEHGSSSDSDPDDDDDSEDEEGIPHSAPLVIKQQRAPKQPHIEDNNTQSPADTHSSTDPPVSTSEDSNSNASNGSTTSHLPHDPPQRSDFFDDNANSSYNEALNRDLTEPSIVRNNEESQSSDSTVKSTGSTLILEDSASSTTATEEISDL